MPPYLFLLVFFRILPEIFSLECSEVLNCTKNTLSKNKLKSLQGCINYNQFQIPLANENETKNTVWFHYGEPTILDLDLVKQQIDFERTTFLAYADYRLKNPDCSHQIIKLNIKVPELWIPKFRLKNIISISTALDYSYHFPEEYIKFFILPVSIFRLYANHAKHADHANIKEIVNHANSRLRSLRHLCDLSHLSGLCDLLW